MNDRTLSIIAFVVLLAAILLLLKYDSLFGRDVVTIGLQVVSALLMIWARITFGKRSFHAGANPTAGGLVTTGPYRYVRHPIYSAIMLFIASGVAANWSVVSAPAGIIAIAAVFVRIHCEEKLVVLQYPEYAEYALATKRLIPYVY